MRRFSDLNPIVITVYMLVIVGIAMFCTNPIIFFISLAAALGFSILLKENGKKTYLYCLLMFLILSLINPIMSHNGVTVLFVINNNPVTMEAFIYGISSALMLMAVFIWFSSYSKIMTSDKLLYLFGALSPKLSLILSMALRYVPLFKNQSIKVEQAQRACGLYKEDNMADNIKNKLSVFDSLVGWALENGIITADSMSARAYGTGKRSFFYTYKFKLYDYIILAVSLCLGIICIVTLPQIEFVYYPAIIIPENTIEALASYIAYGILGGLPLFIEIKEKIKWKYLESKI